LALIVGGRIPAGRFPLHAGINSRFLNTKKDIYKSTFSESGGMKGGSGPSGSVEIGAAGQPMDSF